MKYFLALAVLFNLFVWGGKVLNPDMLKQKDSKEWAQLFEYVHSSNVILNSPTIASEIVRLGKIPMDSGQTSYFYGVQPFSKNLFTGTSYEIFENDGYQYVLLMDRMVKKERFDLVILTEEKATFFHSKILTDYYSQVDELKLEMPQTQQQWTMLLFRPLEK